MKLTMKHTGMLSEIKKNIQFTELIKADGRQREFNFTRTRPYADPYFKVDVVDDRGNRISFEMQHTAAGWRLVQGLAPAWIYEQELVMHQVIERQLELLEPASIYSTPAIQPDPANTKIQS